MEREKEQVSFHGSQNSRELKSTVYVQNNVNFNTYHTLGHVGTVQACGTLGTEDLESLMPEGWLTHIILESYTNRANCWLCLRVLQFC